MKLEKIMREKYDNVCKFLSFSAGNTAVFC